MAFTVYDGLYLGGGGGGGGEEEVKHSHWAEADNSSGPKVLCQREGLITMVICCKFNKNLFNL